MAGKQLKVRSVFCGFASGGTGTVQIKSGTTTIWSASVNGGLHMEWPMQEPTTATGADLVVTLSGGWIWVVWFYES